MDRNLLLAIVLSVLIIVGFQYFFNAFAPPTPVNAPSTVELTKKTETAAKKASEESKVTKELAKTAPELSSTSAPESVDQNVPGVQAKESLIKIETPKYEAVLTNIGGKIISFKLKNYTANLGSPELVNLFPPEGPDTSEPTIRLTRSNEVFSDAKLVYTSDMKDSSVELGEAAPKKAVVFRGVSSSGLVLSKKFTFHADNYLIDLSYVLENKSNEDRDYLVTLPLRKYFSDDSKQFSWNSVQVLLDGSLKDYYFKDVKGDEETFRASGMGWSWRRLFFQGIDFSPAACGQGHILQTAKEDVAEILVRCGAINLPAGGKSKRHTRPLSGAKRGGRPSSGRRQS